MRARALARMTAAPARPDLLLGRMRFIDQGLQGGDSLPELMQFG
jgi:hypothetical protein